LPCNELELHLLGSQAPKAPHTDPRAYSLYLQGRQYFELYSSPGYEQALAALNEALAIDRNFAPAWATLGALYWSASNNSLIDYDEGAARHATPRRMRLRSTSIMRKPCHCWAYSTWSSNAIWISECAASPERSSSSRTIIAYLLARASLRDATVDSMTAGYAEQALRCDPLSPNAHAALGFCLYGAGRLEEAEVMRRKVLALSPGWLSGHYYLGRILLARHDLQGALAAMQAEPSHMWRSMGLAIVNHALGRTDEADAALAEFEQLPPAGHYYQLAEVYAYRGDIDASFGFLDQALETHDSGLIDTGCDPLLANLHADPRWRSFLSRAGLA